MTAQNKTTIKSYFQTNDRPTQAQFEDFIDSYQDASQVLSNIVSAASAGNGVLNIAGVSAATLLPLGAVGQQLLSVATTAAALNALGGSTGTGAIVLTSAANIFSPTITTPNTIGVNTSFSAPAGSVGELKQSTVLSGAAVTMTTNQANNITFIPLTAGVWVAWGNIGFISGGGGAAGALVASINTTSSAHGTPPNGGAYSTLVASFGANATNILTAGYTLFSLAASANAYLVGTASFTNTLTAYGYVGALRIL